jgi:hypothetical protein
MIRIEDTMKQLALNNKYLNKIEDYYYLFLDFKEVLESVNLKDGYISD